MAFRLRPEMDRAGRPVGAVEKAEYLKGFGDFFMQIQIEGRHIKVTAALQEHVHKKIDHMDKYFHGVGNCHVILGTEPPKNQSVEIICNVAHGQPLVAKASQEDMYLAIDEAVHKIREHLKKHKGRLRGRRRDSSRMNKESIQPGASSDEKVEDDDQVE